MRQICDAEGFLTLPVPEGVGASDPDVTVGLRPEGIDIVPDGADGAGRAQKAEVVAVEPFGSEVIVDVKLGEQSVKIRTAPDVRPAPGSNIALRADPAAVRLFDRATGAAIQ
jgi:multiple sugar transport system ATP-binding protein